MTENQYIVHGQIYCIVWAESKEEAEKVSRSTYNWEDWDWYEQDIELYQERTDVQ